MPVASRLAAPLIVALALLSLTSGCQTTTATAPAASRAALDGFIDFYFNGYRSGLPNAEERAALAPMASPAFNAALEQAARAERCAYARHQGAEPPMIQGDLFSSLFEKATGVVSAAPTEATTDRVDYSVNFEYRLPGATSAETQWHDTVRLIRSGNAWLVDDVVHGGDWDFASKGSVKEQLLAVAALCTTE